MGGSGGGGGGGRTEYSKYVEAEHQGYITKVKSYVTGAITDYPLMQFSSIDIDDSFFGTGYMLSSFPALYDMFGKFMAGLDIDVLSNQMLEDTVNSTTINNLVGAEANLLSDHVETKIIPKFQTGMRDINAVLSSSFVIGKSLIAESEVKAIEKYSSELRYRMIPVALEKWKIHLTWNEGVVRNYAEILKLYISAKIDTEEYNTVLAEKNSYWPFTVLEYQRAAVAALQGGSNVAGGVGISKAQKAIGGALSGAATGFMLSGGNPIGAAAGGVLGGAAAFL